MSESADHLGVGPRPWFSQSHHGGNSGCEGQRRWRLKDSTPEIRKRKSRQDGRSTVFSGIFVNMESEFGKHRESRLKNLKSVDEKEGIGTER